MGETDGERHLSRQANQACIIVSSLNVLTEPLALRVKVKGGLGRLGGHGS
jgi:hypothetical protein